MVTEVLAPNPAPLPVGAGNPVADLVRERSLLLGDVTFLESAPGSRRVSFRRLDHVVAAWGTRLDEAGFAPGVRVAIAIADPMDFCEVFLGVMASGRWAVPLDPSAPVQGPGGINAALSCLEAACVVADRPAPRASTIAWMNVGEGTGLTPRPPREAIHQSCTILPGDPEWTAGEAGGVVLASSGTTGEPKLIPLTYHRLLYAARNVAVHHGLSPVDRGFNPLPMFHINAEVVALLASLIAGSRLVLDDRFHRNDFWAVMARHAVTWINAVPAIISRLAEPELGEAVPTGIRFIRSASAPLPLHTLTRFEAKTGIPVVETYGMTEAASQITANPLDSMRKPGSVGLPVGVELRVTPGRQPTQVTSGQGSRYAVGNVEIRGPSVITAYGDQHHADRFDGDGWLRTGDLGHVDEEGFLYIDGRSDDVINRGGEKVFPREIEEAMLLDPDVTDVAVVGEDDPVLGQVPVAYLVLDGVKDGSDLARAAELTARIRHGLESVLVRSKRPLALRVVAQLPTGPTGKVRPRALRGGEVPVICQFGSP
jgi:oxalate---CoA ligase